MTTLGRSGTPTGTTLSRTGSGSEVPDVSARPGLDPGRGAGGAVRSLGGVAAPRADTAAGSHGAGQAGRRGPGEGRQTAARHRGRGRAAHRPAAADDAGRTAGGARRLAVLRVGAAAPLADSHVGSGAGQSVAAGRRPRSAEGWRGAGRSGAAEPDEGPGPHRGGVQSPRAGPDARPEAHRGAGGRGPASAGGRDRRRPGPVRC